MTQDWLDANIPQKIMLNFNKFSFQTVKLFNGPILRLEFWIQGDLVFKT